MKQKKTKQKFICLFMGLLLSQFVLGEGDNE
jgi:hypothetical protein